MKRSVVFLLTLVLAVSMLAVGCGDDADTTDGSGAAVGSEVVNAIMADPGDLGPFVGMSMGRIAVLNTMYEYLITEDPVTEEFVNCIAQEVVVGDDNTSATVTLYDYVTDSAGNAITAADVAWCYTTAKAADVYRPLGDMESATATDDVTVEFVLVDGLSEDDVLKVVSEVPIVSQAAYEATTDQMASMPVTSSIYTLTDNVVGSSLTFEKNEDYWQTDEALRSPYAVANVDKIVFEVIAEAAQHAIAMETGTADISGGVAGIDVARFEDNSDYNVTSFLDNLTYCLMFNGTEGNAFTSLELRQAVAYALDTQAICDGVDQGGCTASSTIGNTNFAGYLEKWNDEEYYTQDLDEAAQLFADSGAEEGMTAVLLVEAGEKGLLMAQVIQAQLADLGITVDISSQETAVYNEELDDPTAWDLAIRATAGGGFAYSPWALIYAADRYNGVTSNWFDDPELQNLLTAASTDDSEANLDAFVQYDRQQVYAYAILSYKANVVSVSGVTAIATDSRGQVTPGRCEYASDFE